MRKYPLVLLLILLTGLMAGCISSNSTTTTPTESIPSETQTLSPTTTSSPTVTHTETPTESPKKYDTLELLQEVSEIRQFSYASNATISMRITMEQEGIVQKDQVNLTILEEGYMDFESRSAWINSTTMGMPGGPSSKLSQIIVGDITYIQTSAGWIETEDANTSRFFWEYNLASLARKYLSREPDERREDDFLTLIYYPESSDIEPLARMYFAATPDTAIQVGNGTVEFYFKDGKLIGGKISYTVVSETVTDDPMLGTMIITQEGSWNAVIWVSDINKKKSVEKPST